MNDEENTTRMFGKWRTLRVDNYDAYLAALGINYIQRKIATKTTTYLEISKDGEEWVWRLTVLVFSEETRFTLGKEFDDLIQPGKQKVKTTVTLKDGILTFNKAITPLHKSIYYLEGNNTLISEDWCGDVHMKATYERIE